MKKHFSILSVLFVLLTLFVLFSPTLAVDEVTDETVTESLKQTLEEVATEEKLEKAKSVLSDRNAFYAYVGPISDIDENILTIKSKKGEKKVEVTDESTLVLYKDKKESPIELDDIEEDSYAIAMGKMQDDETIKVARMMLSEKPDPLPEKKVIFGKIEEIDEKKVKIKNEEELELEIPKNLNLKIAGVSKPEIEDIELDDKTIIVLQEDGLIAMFVIPGKHSAASEENQLSATESAEVASPSAEKP